MTVDEPARWDAQAERYDSSYDDPRGGRLVRARLEKEDSLRRQIKSAMVYPSVIMTFALIVLLALVTFLVPVFVGVFKQFGGDLPTITKFTVGLSNSIKGYWWAWILLTAGAVWLFRKWKSTHRGRGQWDAFRLRVPMKIGDIVQKVALARWSRTLSALVSAGVPLLAALDITAKTAGNRVVENAMADVIERLSTSPHESPSSRALRNAARSTPRTGGAGGGNQRCTVRLDDPMTSASSAWFRSSALLASPRSAGTPFLAFLDMMFPRLAVP